jgi:hypothetical protein
VVTGLVVRLEDIAFWKRVVKKFMPIKGCSVEPCVASLLS